MSKHLSRLVRGGHSNKHDKKVLPSGDLAPCPRQGFAAGDVIQSDTDLAALYPEKFEYVQEIQPVRVKVLEEVSEAEEGPVTHTQTDPPADTLQSLTVAELKALATEEELDVDFSLNKQALIDAIREARSS